MSLLLQFDFDDLTFAGSRICHCVRNLRRNPMKISRLDIVRSRLSVRRGHFQAESRSRNNQVGTLMRVHGSDPTGRERPFPSNFQNIFFHGGTSFPSDHAAVTWAFASIVAQEYPHPAAEIGAYGLARMSDDRCDHATFRGTNAIERWASAFASFSSISSILLFSASFSSALLCRVVSSSYWGLLQVALNFNAAAWRSCSLASVCILPARVQIVYRDYMPGG